MQRLPVRSPAILALMTLAWPAALFGAQAASSAAEAVALPYSLLRSGGSGETTTYRIVRINRTVDRRGRTIGTMKAHALLDRTLIEEVEPGVWVEDFTWRAFRMGSPPDFPSADAAPLLRQRIDPRSVDLLDTMPEVTGMEPIAAILFRVLILDGWTWDAVVHGLRMAAGPEVSLGREFVIPGWDSARVIPLGVNAEVRYRLAPIRTRADGVTLCGDEPCLRVAFRIEGNEVEQHMGPMQIDGVESFHGAAYLSLHDGRLVRGELWGPFLSTLRPAPDAEPTPTSGFLTEVVMEEVGRR